MGGLVGEQERLEEEHNQQETTTTRRGVENAPRQEQQPGPSSPVVGQSDATSPIAITTTSITTSSQDDHPDHVAGLTPRRSSSRTFHSQDNAGTPGSPGARTSTSTSSHFRILRSFSSRFVEDLPEFQPYSEASTTRPRRGEFRSSPAVSFVRRRRRKTSHATNRDNNDDDDGDRSETVSQPRTPASSSHGIMREVAAVPQDHTNQHASSDKKSSEKKKRRWRSVLFAFACLGIAAIASIPKAGHPSSSSLPPQQQYRPNTRSYNQRASSFPSHPSAMYNPSIKRRPSKLKKRPPSTIPCPSLQSRRGSTYAEWRRSMVVEVSADVSRRSSQRSRKSTG